MKQIGKEVLCQCLYIAIIGLLDQAHNLCQNLKSSVM